MTLGKRISKLRSQRKISQEYLAEQLDVSRQAVSKWENDSSSPDTDHLVRLAELFGVSVDYLATGKEDPPIRPSEGSAQFQKVLRKLSFLFFIIAFASHCIGLFSGAFTKPLIPVFPYLWYGDSALAITLNVFTAVCTVGWIGLLVIANKAKGSAVSAP